MDGEVEAQGYRKVSQIVIPCIGYGLGVCKPPMLFFFPEEGCEEMPVYPT